MTPSKLKLNTRYSFLDHHRTQLNEDSAPTAFLKRTLRLKHEHENIFACAVSTYRLCSTRAVRSDQGTLVAVRNRLAAGGSVCACVCVCRCGDGEGWCMREGRVCVCVGGGEDGVRGQEIRVIDALTSDTEGTYNMLRHTAVRYYTGRVGSSVTCWPLGPVRLAAPPSAPCVIARYCTPCCIICCCCCCWT